MIFFSLDSKKKKFDRGKITTVYFGNRDEKETVVTFSDEEDHATGVTASLLFFPIREMRGVAGSVLGCWLIKDKFP